MPRVDVFVKTWYRDLGFCFYALQFLDKNWREPGSRFIVLANEDCRSEIETWNFGPRFQFYYVDPWPDTNQFECYLTLLFDHFSDAELFAVFDSDTMLQVPLQLCDRMEKDKPIIYYKTEAELLTYPEGRVTHKLWFPIMEYWLSEKPKVDYMCQFPFIYWASTLAGVRRVITNKTKWGLLESLYSDCPFDPKHFLDHPFKFTEHPVIGFYAYLYEGDRYVFKPWHEDQPAPVKKYHSWTEWSPELASKLKKQLASL